MSRYDKYEPMGGGFRAPLGFAVNGANLNKVLPVGLDTNGRVVLGSGNTGVLGVLVLTMAKAIGAIVDVMQDGEIVENTGLTAGTRYYGSAAGAVTTTNTDVKLGWTVEATRLIVRVGR